MDTRFRCILLLAGAALLLLVRFIGPVPVMIEQAAFFASLLLTGIPHGAMDHLVQASSSANSRSFQWKAFLLNYLSPVLAFTIIWMINPWYALVGFLLISGKHFSETDLLPGEQNGTRIRAFEQTIFGIIIIGNLLIPHASEVMNILSNMPHSGTVLNRLTPLIQPLYWFLICISIAWAAYNCMKVLQGRRPFILLLQSILLPVLLHELPLLLAFTFYFGAWHSLISIRNIYIVLRQEQGITPLQLLRKAVPFTTIAIIGIFVLIYWGNLAGQLSGVSLGIFIGISIITIPHAQIMSKLFDRLRMRNETTRPTVY